MKDEKKATRQSYGEALLELGKDNADIVVLDADLSTATKTDLFAKEFPNRFFDMGIAESIIYEENQTFQIGKAIQIGEGIDATVFATGVTVAEALKAQKSLKEKGIDIRVVDIHTIKPIDKEIIIKCAKETKKLISIEDHNIIGGMGSAISEVLTNEFPAKLIRLGVNDSFGRSGKAEELMKFFGITAENIVELFLS